MAAGKRLPGLCVTVLVLAALLFFFSAPLVKMASFPSVVASTPLQSVVLASTGVSHRVQVIVPLCISYRLEELKVCFPSSQSVRFLV